MSIPSNSLHGKSEITGERIFYLDFIRVIAICLIIIVHFNFHTLAMNISDSPIFWTTLGLDYSFQSRIGVSLFIILSGASLMLSTKERFNAKTFYKKRFFSIYPLFWITYATIFLGLFLLNRNLPFNHLNPATFFLTIMGLDGFLLFAIPNYYLLGEWFLGFIIILYMIFPLLRYLFLHYQLITILSCLFITLLITLFYNLEMSIGRFPPSRLIEFVFGMGFIYYLSHSRKTLHLLFFGIAVVLLSLMMILNMPLLFNVAIQGISVFLFLTILSSLFDNALFARYIRFLGAYSFGAFLVHHVILLQILPFLENQHLSIFHNYLLFFGLLLVIYVLSFLLTNLTAIGLRRIGVNN